MKFIPLSIPEVIRIEPEVYEDARGFFMESYQLEKYAQGGVQPRFIQDNHSGSHRGILRGLHYQIRQVQGKLIEVVVGRIYDVAVDLRTSSPTFKQWVGLELSTDRRQLLWIPPGFAHGYYVISDWAEIIYKTTDFYAPEWERTLLWNDPQLGIQWPLDEGREPILSEKDSQGLLIDDLELFD